MGELGFELPSDDCNLTPVLICLQCQKFPSEIQLTVNSDYISSPFQKYRKEIKLCLITLQRSSWCLGSHWHVRIQGHILHRSMFCAAGPWPFCFSWTVCKHQETVKRTQTYLCHFIRNKTVFVYGEQVEN